MKILVTGAAGFIGSQVARALLGRGHTVVGLDNINDYYPRILKFARLSRLGIRDAGEMLDFAAKAASAEAVISPAAAALPPSRFASLFRFYLCDVADRTALPAIFRHERFDAVIHLAARAGVRHSLKAPFEYLESNVTGFLNILECCLEYGIGHLVYASSSSVYGNSAAAPFREDAGTDSPESLYAATKKADEVMAACYSNLYGLRVTGLRYFTVYGPWGRPDMAPMLFAKAILASEPIRLFNNGDMIRDFTYIDDIVEGSVRVLESAPERPAPGISVHGRQAPEEAASESKAPENRATAHGDGSARAGNGQASILNIGGGSAVPVSDFIAILEKHLGRKAIMEPAPMQPGDVKLTCADVAAIRNLTGFAPKTGLEEGIGRFAEWYLSDENPLR